MQEKFEQQKAPESKTKAENKQEWKEHFGVSAEIEEEKEKTEKIGERVEAKVKAVGEQKKEKEWSDYFGELAEVQKAMEKTSKQFKKEAQPIESAKAPAQPIEHKEILKAAAVPDKMEYLRAKYGKYEEEQQEREKTIETLQDAKVVGRERLDKVVEGLSYVAAADKLALIGLKEGGKLAKEGGRWLSMIGLVPLAVLEETGRVYAGQFENWAGAMGKSSAEARIKSLEEIPADKRPDFYKAALEDVKEDSRKNSGRIISGLGKLYQKGKLLDLIFKLRG